MKSEKVFSHSYHLPIKLEGLIKAESADSTVIGLSGEVVGL